MRFLKCAVIILAIFSSGIFQGCRSTEYFKKLRIENADCHFSEINKRIMPENKVFALPECIEFALKNNLDIKAQELREAVDREKATAAILGMLPDLNVEHTGTARFNEPGASSENVVTGAQSLASSKSTEKQVYETKVELIFSILDFGLAYFNSIQAEDRTILTAEQKRYAMHSLIMDVVRAYYKVAATQHAMQTTETLIAMSENTETTLSEIRESGNIQPLKVLEEKKAFLRLKQKLREYKRSYENSCVELMALMGYYPVSQIRVDTSCFDTLQEAEFTDIEILERIALEERPELSQLDIQSDITVIEARKAILSMFPNVKAFGDFTNSTNKYLYNQSWWEIGIRAAYRLFRLPAQIEEWRAWDKQIDEINMRTLALSVGVIAQVRIGHANFLEVKDRYYAAEEIYSVCQEHLKEAKKISGTTGGLSPIEVRKYELETATAAIEKTLEMGNYYLAYYRLLNALGVQFLDEEKIAAVKGRLRQTSLNSETKEKIIKIEPVPEESQEAEISMESKPEKQKVQDIKIQEPEKVIVPEKIANPEKEEAKEAEGVKKPLQERVKESLDAALPSVLNGEVLIKPGSGSPHGMMRRYTLTNLIKDGLGAFWGLL